MRIYTKSNDFCRCRWHTSRGYVYNTVILVQWFSETTIKCYNLQLKNLYSRKNTWYYCTTVRYRDINRPMDNFSDPRDVEKRSRPLIPQKSQTLNYQNEKEKFDVSLRVGSEKVFSVLHSDWQLHLFILNIGIKKTLKLAYALPMYHRK